MKKRHVEYDGGSFNPDSPDALTGSPEHQVARFEAAFRAWEHGEIRVDAESQVRFHQAIGVDVLKIWWVEHLSLDPFPYAKTVQKVTLNAREVCKHATLFDMANDDDARAYHAARVGYFSGLMAGAMESLRHSKSALLRELRRNMGVDERREMLKEFISKHGDVPDKGTFGKPNPLRTRYFQRFKRASGLEFSVDTFNRDVEALLGDARGPV